jgi:hypothetical protein
LRFSVTVLFAFYVKAPRLLSALQSLIWLSVGIVDAVFVVRGTLGLGLLEPVYWHATGLFKILVQYEIFGLIPVGVDIDTPIMSWPGLSGHLLQHVARTRRAMTGMSPAMMVMSQRP